MTAYSFADLRIKSMQIKGERPVIVILSGAGLSAESGIPTYRNADNNWNRTDSMDSVDMKHRPQLVFDSINRRIEAYDQAKPNAAHLSIAKFKKKWRNKADIIHITQNIDTLCEEAGDAGVFHLHGSFLTSRCTECGATFPRLGLYKEGNVCPACKASGWSVRTDVVLFGERPHGLDWIPGVLRRADVFVAVGTSGMVYPAAGFVTEARRRNCRTRLLIAKDAPFSRCQPKTIPWGTSPSLCEATQRQFCLPCLKRWAIGLRRSRRLKQRQRLQPLPATTSSRTIRLLDNRTSGRPDMPRRIDNFTSYFHRKQRDLYFVTFTQATKDPMGFPAVRDCEAIDGRRELLDWLREKLPSTDVGPILPFDSDSGFIAMPYDGSIYVDFTPEDLEKFENRWETPDGKSIDSRWQCYLYTLEEYKEKHGGRIPAPEEYFD